MVEIIAKASGKDTSFPEACYGTGGSRTDPDRAGLLLFSLGNVLTKQGRHDESLDYHQRALSQFRATGSANDLDVANAYYKLASHYLR